MVHIDVQVVCDRTYILADGFAPIEVANGAVTPTDMGTMDDPLGQWIVRDLGGVVAAMQRGHLALHAAGVARHGRVALLLGPPGVGKSAVAARLSLGSWQVVADDMVALSVTANSVLAHPGDGWIRVREEDVSALRLDSARLNVIPENDASHPPKMAYDLADSRAERPLPVSAVYVLDPAGAPQPRRVRGAEFVTALQQAWYHPFLVRSEGVASSYFKMTCGIARVVPGFAIGRLEDDADQLADALACDFEVRVRSAERHRARR